MSLKKLNVEIGANTSGLQKGVKETKSTVASLKSGVGSMIKTGLGIMGITAGFAALAAGAKKSFTAFVGFESSVKRTADLFGGANKHITAFAEGTGKAFGLAETSAYEYAAIYGNLFKNITRSSEENAQVTTQMLKASAVVASKTGRTMDDVMERIRSGLLGNTEAIEDLGINVNVAMLEVTDSFKRIANGRSWQQLTFYEQQQIRTLAILEQAHKNYGDEVQKGSAYNLSALSGSLKDLTAYAGQFINAGLQPIIKALTQVVQAATAGLKSLSALFGLKIDTGSTKGTEAQTTAQAALTDETEETAKAQQKLLGLDEINTASSGSSAKASAGNAGSAFAGLASTSTSAPAPDTSWISGTQSKLTGFAKSISEIFAPSISAWGSAFDKLKTPTENAVKRVGSSLSGLWNNTLAPLGSYIGKNFIPSITNGFSTTFAPIFGQAMPVMIDQFAKDFEFSVGMAGRLVKDYYMPSMELMKKVSVDVFGGIKKAWDNHGTGILEGFAAFKEGVRRIWTSIYDNVFAPVFGYIGDTVNWLWDQHLKPLWDNIADFFGSVGEFVLMLWNEFLAPFVDFIVKNLGPPIAFVFGMIADVFGTTFGMIADVVGGILKALGGLLDFLTGVFTGNWKKAWDGIKNFFIGIWDAIWGVVKGTVNLVIDGINLLWGGIYTVVKGIVDGIGGIAGAIGSLFGQDWKFSMPAKVPKIPKLADGGLAYGRTLVEVGEYAGASGNPEVIAPLDKLADMTGSFGGDIYLTEHIYLNDGTLIDSFSRKINRKGNQGGASLVPATS